MRKAAFYIGLIGALGALILGLKWISDWNSDLSMISRKLSSQGIDWKFAVEFENLKTAAYLLIICGLTGLVVSVLTLASRIKTRIIAVILIVSGVLPLFFSGKALFGAPMVVAGVMVLVSKPEDAAEID